MRTRGSFVFLHAHGIGGGRGAEGRRADVDGARREETPRLCTPGRFVPACWGVSTGSSVALRASLP